jgi:hypothetical protein
MRTHAITTEPIPPVTDPWLTLRQGSDYAQADEVTLRREIKRGRLRAARIGGRKCFRLRRSGIDAWLIDGATSLSGPPGDRGRPSTRHQTRALRRARTPRNPRTP